MFHVLNSYSEKKFFLIKCIVKGQGDSLAGEGVFCWISALELDPPEPVLWKGRADWLRQVSSDLYKHAEECVCVRAYTHTLTLLKKHLRIDHYNKNSIHWTNSHKSAMWPAKAWKIIHSLTVVFCVCTQIFLISKPVYFPLKAKFALRSLISTNCQISSQFWRCVCTRARHGT